MPEPSNQSDPVLKKSKLASRIPVAIKISATLITVIGGIIGILLQLGIINPKNKSTIQIGTTLVVENTRAYFYTTPNLKTMNNSYLITGDQVTVVDISGDFVLVNFYNAKKEIATKGYIRIADTRVEE